MSRAFCRLALKTRWMWDAGEKRRIQAVVERDDHSALRAGHEVDMRRIGAHAAVHAVALTEQRRPDNSRQRAACHGAVCKRDVVLACRRLRNDDAFARVAIDGCRVHLHRRPTCLAVAGQERGQPLDPFAVQVIVGRKRRMSGHLPCGERAVLGGGIDLLRPLLASVGRAHRHELRKEFREVSEELERGTHVLEVAARQRRSGIRARRRPDDHFGQ
jgi:hypothetical protein